MPVDSISVESTARTITVGVERDVGGMPVFTLPEGNIQTADLTAIKTALKAMRVDENMYLLLPFGSELSAYSAGAKQIKASEVIVRYQKIIFMRVFAQFILIHRTVGGRAG